MIISLLCCSSLETPVTFLVRRWTQVEGENTRVSIIICCLLQTYRWSDESGMRTKIVTAETRQAATTLQHVHWRVAGWYKLIGWGIFPTLFFPNPFSPAAPWARWLLWRWAIFMAEGLWPAVLFFWTQCGLRSYHIGTTAKENKTRQSHKKVQEHKTKLMWENVCLLPPARNFNLPLLPRTANVRLACLLQINTCS